MADYRQLLEFYEEYRHYMDSSQRVKFNTFFDMYPHEYALKRGVDYIRSFEVPLVERVYIDKKPHVSGVDPYERELALEYMLMDDFDDLIEGMKFNITNDENVETRKVKPLDTRVYPNKPIVRKRRQQWGGKPNFRTVEFNPRKSVGYALRSMKRHLPKIDHLSIKDVQEKMKRSVSHVHIKAEVTTFETQKSRMEVDLFDAYDTFARHLFELEQESTDNKKDAWDVTMPSGALDDFIKDHYSPTITAFAELPSDMRDFIAKEWNEYGENSRKGREQAYGYNLSKEQVGNLQDADLSYLREMM